jgi:hypothetical protein
VGKRLSQMSCCTSVQERRDEQGPREAWKDDEQEMFRLQDRTALIPNVRNRTLTLIEREDDTRSWGNILVYFSHNVMPT